MKAMEIRKGLSAGNGARRSWSKPPGTGTAGRSRPATGLEKPTFVEWVVDRLPLPYAVGCGVLAVLLGPPGNVLARFLDSGSLNGSFNEYFLGEGLSATGLQLAALLLSCVHGFYLLWIIRFIRLKALAAEPALAALLPGGKDRYRRLLVAISYAGAPILLAVVFTALSWESLIPIIRDSKGLFHSIYLAATIPLNHLLHGTALWVYLVVLGGLYRLGREPLKKDPLHRDRLMGVRPMGSLSLSISAAYFGTLTLMVPLAFINPVTVAYSALLAVLVVLGIVLFFLPLHSIHRQMLAEKRREQESISRRAIQAAAASAEVPAVPHQATLADLRNLLADLRDIMAIEMAERRVAGINTWPFDTAILRRLAVIAIPVTAAVTSNLLIKVVLRL